MHVFRRLCLAGIDRYNSSFALDLKRTGFRGSIVALAGAAEVNQSWKQGVVNGGGPVVPDQVAGADLVLISATCPPETLTGVFASADDGSIVATFDRVPGEADRLFAAAGRKDLAYIGIHVWESAPPDLDPARAAKFFFDGKTVILTPPRVADEPAALRLQHALELMGARVTLMDPATYERLVARTLQLPHLAVMAVMRAALDDNTGVRLTPELLGPWLAGGLKQLVAMPAAEWERELTETRATVLTCVEELIAGLQRLKPALTSGRIAGELETLLAGTAALMQPQAGEPAGAPTTDLVLIAGADNKVLERAASLLAMARLSVGDIHKLENAQTGSYRLSLKTVEERDQAMTLLRRAGIEVVGLSS